MFRAENWRTVAEGGLDGQGSGEDRLALEACFWFFNQFVALSMALYTSFGRDCISGQGWRPRLPPRRPIILFIRPNLASIAVVGVCGSRVFLAL